MTGLFSVLLDAVRYYLHPELPPPDRGGTDEAALLRLAAAHGVAPMLENSMDRVDFSLAQSAELARVAGWLDERGIPAISLKGPLLSNYLYGDLAMRSSGDIDLLVLRDDVLRIRDLFTAREYQNRNFLHWHCDSAWLRSREDELSFRSPLGSLEIDIHWRVLPGYFASPFDGLDVWASARTVTLAGRKIRTLSPENILLLLCSHGAKHGFERLGWICDIARFVMVTPELDWSAVLAQARRTQTLRQVVLGVRLAEELLDVSPPIELPRDVQVESLVLFVRNRLHAGTYGKLPASQLIPFCLRMLQTTGQRLRYLAGHFLTPSEAEFRILRLPPALYFGYYPFRLLRPLTKAIWTGAAD